MKSIPSEIKVLYDAVLVKKGLPQPMLFHYRKWLRYYLHFCHKYHHETGNKKALARLSKS